MRDKKISDLTKLSQASNKDKLVIVDDSENDINIKTKQITRKDFMSDPGAIGYKVPNTGKFSTLQLLEGPIIDKVSSDETLSEDSEFSIPTEKAVKRYTDYISVDLKVKIISENSIITSGDAALVNSSIGDINILLTPSTNGKIVVKKISSDLNKVIISVIGSGTIDNINKKVIICENESYYFLSDGVNFYII